MTLPREISLVKKNNIHQLKFAPARELKKLETGVQSFVGNGKVDSALFKVTVEIAETEKVMTLTLSNDQGEQGVISLTDGVLSFDRRKSGVTSFHPEFAAIHKADVNGIAIRKMEVFVDVASVEIFVNDGELVLTDIVFPTVPYNLLKLEKDEPKFTIASLSSIWK